MTYEEFQEYVRAKCMYETIYTDSDGREILVIKLLDAYGMVNRVQPEQEQDRQIDQLIQERDHRDEIIDKLCDAVLGPDRYEWSSQYFFEDAVREVEERMAALEAQPEQEPVAWVCEGSASDEKHAVDYQQEDIDAIPVGTMLYTTPPHRKPLTSEEYSILAEKYIGADGLDCVDYGRAIARHYGIKE